MASDLDQAIAPAPSTTVRIAIIATYFGQWPPWFPAFLLSCARNETIDWLVFTDCPELAWAPPNFRRIPFSLKELNDLAGEKTGLTVRKQLYSQCDLRPAYGRIFEDHLEGYDFWGHCDLDVIWGDLRHFFSDAILEGNDIISSRQGQIAGHLSLWRNDRRVNRLFESIPDWRDRLSSPDYVRLDENLLTDHLRSNATPGVYWDSLLVVDYYRLESRPYGWRWVDGKVFGPEGQEVCYLHFMTWKRYMKQIDFGTGATPREFVVLRRGIWSGRLPSREVVLKGIGFDHWFSRALGVKRALERVVWTVLGDRTRQRHESRKRRQW